MNMRGAILCLLCLCLIPAASPRARAAGIPHGKPSITIVSPSNGATVHGSSITVHVAVSHFKLVPPVLLSPDKWKTIPLLKGNQGHIHYVLDSLAALVLTRDVTTHLTHTWTNVKPGPHTVIAYLATSQHAPFPGVPAAKIHVMVQPRHVASRTNALRPQAKPSIKITSVRTTATAQGVNLVVRVKVRHFKLVPPVLLSPDRWKTIPLLKGNQGHIHYVLDSLANFSAQRDAVVALNHPWTDVKPGMHTVIAYLATSQHQRFPGIAPAVAHIYVPPVKSKPGGTIRIFSLPTTGGADPSSLDYGPLLVGGFLVTLGWFLRRQRRS